MRLPRDISGEMLIKRLAHFGYAPVRQSGSHVRLVYSGSRGLHHITIPLHDPLRLGTLSKILSDIAEHLGIEKSAVIQQIQK